MVHWFLFGEESRKKRIDARTARGPHRWYGPTIVVGKEKNNVFVSYRGRVTKVAPEFLRKASVAEQMSWDITTKPDTTARPLNLDEEVARKDDHSEDETQVEEPDPVTQKSRDVVREPLRLPQRGLRSKQPLLLLNWRKEWNRNQKRHGSICQSCCTMHFPQKLLDPKRGNGLA